MKYLAIVCSLIFAIACTEDAHEYSADLYVFTHGTHKILTCKLNDEKVTVIKHSTNKEPDIIVADRVLTKKEKGDLAKFFSSFPLRELKKEYINEQVQGEIHREFKVCVNGRCRTACVYFMEVPPLEALVERFHFLVPGLND